MMSLGKRAEGLRLERMQGSPMWAGDGFRNIHPALAGLRDSPTQRPALSEFLCGGIRRSPSAPLPSMNPLDA